MKIREKLLTAAALLVYAGEARAETTTTVITTKTTTSPQPMPNTDMVEFETFDTNKDGILSMAEVGEELFYLFDRDGNQVIDNIEFDQNSVLTITPMKKETVTMVDKYGDGNIEHTTYTYETFLRQSQLARFADDYDGLSPREFINDSFLALDDNDDKAITLDEWKEAYTAMTIPKNAEQERYNSY